MVKKIRSILANSAVALETVFNEFASDKVNKRMNQTDFKKFAKKYMEKAADHEIDSLYRHFAA